MSQSYKGKLFVYVQGRFANRQTGQVFHDHPSGRFIVTDNIKTADVVVWTGGEDIQPHLYNETALPVVYVSPRRDEDDLRAVGLSHNKIKIGICRGAQLLNVVPNKGTLWQDVDNHGGCEHECIDSETGEIVVLNSLHHQMMRPGPGAEVLCYVSRSTIKQGWQRVWTSANQGTLNEWDDLDPEVVWYPETKCLLFQGHPEFGHKQTTEYFWSLLDRYVLKDIPAQEEKVA